MPSSKETLRDTLGVFFMSAFRVLSIALVTVASLETAHADVPRSNPKVQLITNPTTQMVFAVPKRGPLKLRKLDMDGAHFAGRIMLSGTYVYGRNSSYVSDGFTTKPDLHFIPDPASRALLPYLNEYGPVRGVYFSNGRSFLKTVLSPSTIAKLDALKIKSVTGKLTIVVDRFEATAVCDSPVYTVRFLRIVQPHEMVASNKLAQPIGCG